MSTSSGNMYYYNHHEQKFTFTTKLREIISRRKKSLYLSAVIAILVALVIFWHIVAQEERFLVENWNSTGGGTVTKDAAATYANINYNKVVPLTTDCQVAVAMGSDMTSTRGLFASINSIVSNFGSDERKLCFYIFSSNDDLSERQNGMDCVFGSSSSSSTQDHDHGHNTNKSHKEQFSSVLPSNVEIIHKKIEREKTWFPIIYTADDEAEGNMAGMEYNYARYYIRPENVNGLQKVIWIDSDTIVRGDVQELYDMDMTGYVVAGVNYWEPLRNYLCTNPRLDQIAMKTSDGRKTPFEVSKHLNNGLLILNLAEMQKQRILEKWEKLSRKHDLICLWTQSDKAFNLAINGQYKELPIEWNVGYLGSQEYHRYNDACHSAKMLHWNGAGKPYNAGRSMSLCVDQFDIYDVISQQEKGQCLPKTNR